MKIKALIGKIFKKVYHKIIDWFYGRIDTEKFYRLIRNTSKYIRKTVSPMFIVSTVVSIIYISISMRFFRTFYPVIVLFIFVLVFIIISVRGCLKGDGEINEYSQDN